MPRWLIETFCQLAIILNGALAALIVTLAYAFTWFANGGATVSEPFNPVLQVVFTGLWVGMLAAIWIASRKLLAFLE